MIVTIWRHGEAGRAPTDRRRELTDKGFDDIGFGCHQFLVALQAQDIPLPELILYSPWVRTVQTADVIAAAFTHATSRELAALRPDSTVPAVDTALAALAGLANPPSHVILVSHQPLVSQLVEHYLGERSSVPPLSPGALATLVMDVPAQACGEIRFWAVPPEYEAGL